MCRHRHKNRYCYRLHPELAPDKGNRSESSNFRGKQAAAVEHEVESDNEHGGVNIVASSRINETDSIYDTGASHHFVPYKSLFSDIVQCSKPSKFDQAVGSKTLTHQGKAKLKIGNVTLKLRESIYLPESPSIIISAGRLERLSNIVADRDSSLLIQKQPNGRTVPIAKLIRKNDVYYIYALDTNSNINFSTVVAAPDVARIPYTSSAQRWHQRLGHVGQSILKVTARYVKGLEGIDLGELTTCETCHLSKAQRFVSREQRPIPHVPLDEIFVDTVGKITTATNGHQYAVIITDAKTRMRWAIITQSKDNIVQLLVEWIEFKNSHLGKRIRAIFRNGGTEFLRMKSHC